jgi:hypothetical protein
VWVMVFMMMSMSGLNECWNTWSIAINTSSHTWVFSASWPDNAVGYFTILEFYCLVSWAHLCYFGKAVDTLWSIWSITSWEGWFFFSIIIFIFGFLLCKRWTWFVAFGSSS